MAVNSSIEDIRRRHAAATPGPWRWLVCGNKDVYLAAEHSGRLVVMDFVRQGMQSAAPRFRDFAHCLLETAQHWVQDKTRGPIEHPDAIFIEHAPEDVATLLRALDNAQAALRGLLADPYGCPFCDSGVLRNPAKDHLSDCSYKVAQTLLSDEVPQ